MEVPDPDPTHNYGYGRLKNLGILRIRILNTDEDYKHSIHIID
jgi:hypothetical protein